MSAGPRDARENLAFLGGLSIGLGSGLTAASFILGYAGQDHAALACALGGLASSAAALLAMRRYRAAGPP